VGQYTGVPRNPASRAVKEKSVSESLQQRLAQLSSPTLLPLLRQLRRGLEKESLRVDRDGYLAQTPHSTKLGSALTHPLITTDYSESLLEFITLVSADVDTTLAQLDATHRFVYTMLPDENLWPSSMPCLLGDDADIPVARFGESNIGRMKTIYRVGLGYRYGRRMQTIAGIHYNFSLPEAFWPHYFPGVSGAALQEHVTDAYFGLIRNFRRYVWLLIYLFGASPALSKNFLEGKSHRLQEFDDYTLYQPYGTSLRMGDLGYQSNAQEKLNICYNRLDSYIDTLKNGILNSHADYERIGVAVDGEYRQLSTGLLQIENEFYSPIRPKRVARQGETALTALAHGGVEYIEVRCIDVNPYLPLGIDAELMRFLDAFLLFCLTTDSPPCDEIERLELLGNSKTTVNEGRKPGVKLQRHGNEIGLQQWADELLDQIAQTAQLLDSAHGSSAHSESVMQQRRKIADPELTPSARIVRDLRDQRIPYSHFVLEKAEQHALHFRSRELPPPLLAELVEMAERSVRAQIEIETNDELPFDRYLQKYFDQYRAL
jgi:glutamate--cysteine ligase